MRHLVRQTIRFADVDPAGIVFYPRFYEHFHAAFEDFFDVAAGVPYAQLIAKERLGFPAVHVVSDFKIPLRHGDVIDIEITVSHLGHSSFTCAYRVLRGLEVCASAAITTAAVALDTMTAIPIPDRYRAFLTAFLAPAPA